MSMDRGNREKEAAAVLLSALYPTHVAPAQVRPSTLNPKS